MDSNIYFKKRFMKGGFKVTKKKFNLTDLTKAVYGNEDTNSAVFQANRKKIGNHIKKIWKMLGHPPQRFEAPIEQLDGYVLMIKNILDNPDNDEALKLLNQKLVKGKSLQQGSDEKYLTTLIEILAESGRKTMTDKDNQLFEEWLRDQMSDEYYIESEKNINEVMRIIKNDFSLFDDLSNLKSKLEIQEQYMSDVKALSAIYRHQAKNQLVFQECFLEVLNDNPHLINKKKVYTMEDFFLLPRSIQQEVQELINKRRLSE